MDISEIQYSSLIKKYDNFLAPAMVMKVDGKNVNKIPGVKVSQVDIQLSIESVCSASFTLEDVYDLESSSFRAIIKSCFQLGSVVSIELGYGSSTKTVFWGYIHELDYSFSGTPSISATALDMRRLMMMNKENRTFNEKSYSEIFKEVIRKYSSVYSSTSVDPMVDKIERVVQSVSDYDFVVNELCKKANKEFYVLGGKVYFQAKNKNPVPLITLTWGENLFDFHISRTYCNEEIVVYGIDEKKIVTGKEKVKAEGKSKNLTAKAIRTDIVNPAVKDKKSAEALAKKEAEKRKAKIKSGSGSCIGIPEMIPGRYINIAKVDIDGKSSLKGSLTSVKHSFGTDGFITEFELGG